MKRSLIKEYHSAENELERLVLIESILSRHQEFELQDLLSDLLFVLCNDENCVIRHEAVFNIGQLAIAKGAESLINIDEILMQLDNEKSTVVKHEILETLGFFKSELSRECLKIYQSSLELDLSDTARISLMRSLAL
ncbi:MAG TPA: hypothetical protein PK210_12835 [Bacteroidia bacterium]|nr:hypothetical protein [Bacteroidia bacterium]